MEVEMENGVIHICGKRILCDAIYIYIYMHPSIYHYQVDLIHSTPHLFHMFSSRN